MTIALLNSFQRQIKKEKGQVKTDIDRVFGRKLGLIERIVGCPHQNIGCPFAQENVSYRGCLDCRDRRQFNADTFETYGSFYAPPAVP